MHQTMRNLPCDKIQMDEIWGYVGKKQRHLTEQDDPTQVGDKSVFVAIDADSKLVPSYRVGQRTLPEAKAFVSDLSSRLSNRVQLSSDALSAYVAATEEAFGANVDYGQIVKSTREHESGGRSALRALQLRENAPHDQVHASDASGCRERTLVTQ